MSKKHLEIRSPKGELLATLHITEVEEKNSSLQPSSNGSERKEQPSNAYGGNKMSDPQKRYLFRILAQRGMDKEESHSFLKQRLNVASLIDASKNDARKLIETLLEEDKAIA